MWGIWFERTNNGLVSVVHTQSVFKADGASLNEVLYKTEWDVVTGKIFTKTLVGRANSAMTHTCIVSFSELLFRGGEHLHCVYSGCRLNICIN